MLAANPLSFLSWNPRISDHGSNYDDPWKRASEHVRDLNRQYRAAIPIIATDIETGAIYKERCMALIAEALGVSTMAVSYALAHTGLIQGRYKIVRADAC